MVDGFTILIGLRLQVLHFAFSVASTKATASVEAAENFSAAFLRLFRADVKETLLTANRPQAAPFSLG